MQRLRKTANLPSSIRQQLNMYALAASAAGVGMLAFAQPVEAKIVYTPAHLVVKGGDRDCVDMNHDGVMDFCLAIPFDEGGCFVDAVAGSYREDGIAGSRNGFGVLAIRAGAEIGPGRNFINTSVFQPMAYYYCAAPATWSGLWVVGGKGRKGLTNRYVGIKFKIHGKTHYGWARCSVYPGETSQPLVMTGYAYETLPNKPVIAGKTKGRDVDTEAGTLGYLARGRK
jgi:hypothetical protein